jgi:protein SCO1
MTISLALTTKPESVLTWIRGARHGRLARLLSCAFACLFAGNATAQVNNAPPKEVENVTVDQRLGEKVPLDLQLVDAMGRSVKSGFFFDKRRPVLVTLNYSNCPVLCNVQLNGLVESLNQVDLALGADFQILTVSIDPKETTERIRDTKAKYVSQLTNQPGAADAWHFCTAREASIKRLADSLGFRYTYDKATGEYYHPAMLAFVSPDGVISRYSLDVAFPPEQIKLSLLDASQGTIGSPVDQFIMWCFSYDAERGSYVLVAWRLMRLGAAATVVILLATLIPYWIGRKHSAEIKPLPTEPAASS